MSNFEYILDTAHAAAIAAVEASDKTQHDAGFAWVILDRKTDFAEYCRNNAVVSGSDAFGTRTKPAMTPEILEREITRRMARYGAPNGREAWKFMRPGTAGLDRNALGPHLAGAKAFRDALAAHGIEAVVHHLID